MGTIWVREFKGGLDANRIAETAPGGTLIKGEECHIDRGGQVAKRPKFDPTYTLPAGATKNLAATLSSLYAFGSGDPPAMPAGVRYQRLQHPDGATPLSRVLSYDLYAGLIYAVAEFADGGRFHFYNGVLIGEWFDGRARASFTISLGAGGSSLDTLLVNGVDILGGAVAWVTSDIVTAALIAAAINTEASTPDYTATVDNATIHISAVDPGVAANGLLVTYTATTLGVTPASSFPLTGGVDTTNAVQAVGSLTVTGGTDDVANKITALTVNGVDILGAAVQWTLDNSTTAAAIASQINSFTSTPDYTAISAEGVVTITASDSNASVNGLPLVPTLIGNFAVGSLQAMSGGVAAQAVYVPGTFAKTIGSRAMSVSGPNLNGSGIKNPTVWTTDAVGAFFIDMSQQTSGAETLTALAEYQGFVAVFAERVTMIWLIDSDPNNNKKQQTLKNTGTSCPRSVTQFGDSDLFYLDESGVRSIRARDASNAAATTDMGTPIDKLITAKLSALSDSDRQKVVGLINPQDKRFWLVFPDQIFVFTLFEGVKISAWTTYTPFYFDAGGNKVAFAIDDVAVMKRRVYLRGGDQIFCFGGVTTGTATDATQAVAWTPFLDGESPTVSKEWEGVDTAVRGTWEVSAGMLPTEAGLEVDEVIARVTDTTFNGEAVPLKGKSTHISLRFVSQGEGDATLSSCLVRFKSDKAE